MPNTSVVCTTNRFILRPCDSRVIPFSMPKPTRFTGPTSPDPSPAGRTGDLHTISAAPTTGHFDLRFLGVC